MLLSTLQKTCCMCLCKDTNFKANHNLGGIGETLQNVVCAYAKILILKQITTNIDNKTDLSCCMCLCKDTNFKANHNRYRSISAKDCVVCAYAKILILKQITTMENKSFMYTVLYVPMQRY